MNIDELVSSIEFEITDAEQREAAARLKDATDLDSVRDDLAGVVRQALEPARVSVWISERG